MKECNFKRKANKVIINDADGKVTIKVALCELGITSNDCIHGYPKECPGEKNCVLFQIYKILHKKDERK